MAEDKSFKQLIEEQKKTNKLLMQQIASVAKGSDLGTSFKNSAGEIINDVLIGNKQKRESDETQAVIKKGNEDTKTITGKNQDKNFKIFTKMSEALTGAFVTKGKNGSSVKNEEKDKDEKKTFKEIFGTYLGKNSWVGKQLSEIGGFFSKYFKKFKDTGKGILKVLFGVAVYGLVLQYLNSPGFKEFLKGDAPKKIAAAAKRIFGKGGLLSQLSLLIIGDGSVENKGLLGHLIEISSGFLGLTNKSGWKSLGEALGLIDKTIGGDKKGEGEEGGSMLGNLNLLQKAFVVVAGALAISALLPGGSLLAKTGLLLGGVYLIGLAMERLNSFLGLTAEELNNVPLKDADGNDIPPATLAQKRDATINLGTVAPQSSPKVNNLRVDKAFKPPSGLIVSKNNPKNLVEIGKDGKGTFNKAPQPQQNKLDAFNKNTKANKPKLIDRLLKIVPELPPSLRKPLNYILRRIPVVSQALVLDEFMKIMGSNLPMNARPDKESKTRSL